MAQPVGYGLGKVGSLKPMWRDVLLGVLAVIVGGSVASLSVHGLTSLAMHFLGWLTFIILLWIFEVVPAGVAGLLFMLGATYLHFAPPALAFSGFTNPVLWLIVAGLGLGAAANESGLGKRLAYLMLKRIRGDRPGHLLFMLLVVGAVLTQMIPTVFGRLAILLPIGIGLAKTLGIQKGSRYGKFLMAAIFFASSGPYLMTMTGFEPTLAAIASLAHAGHPIYWDQYFIMWVVPGFFLTSFLFYGVTMLLFKPRREELVAIDVDHVREELARLGPMSKRELKVLIVFALVVLFWMTGSLTHFPPTTIAILGLVALFLPGIEALSPAELMKNMSIVNIIFFAAALSIGPLLGHLNLITAFGHLMRQYLPGKHLDFATSFWLGALVQILHVPMSTVTATMATVSPIFEHYAVAQHLNPVTITWIVVASGSAYFLPYQNEPLLMAYGEGYWSMGDMIKLGSLISLATLILVPLFTVTWWAWTVH